MLNEEQVIIALRIHLKMFIEEERDYALGGIMAYLHILEDNDSRIKLMIVAEEGKKVEMAKEILKKYK